MPEIVLPYGGWKPRPYQRKLWNYLESGGRRAVCVWHRRAGKDEVLLHRTAVAAFERPANYWHCLPLFTQCRKAIWDAVSAHTGKRRIFDAFPQELIESINDQEMKIRFKNGATWQLVGSDRYDTLVGAGTAGVTFSEYALANPSAYGYIRPMIAENNGWVAMISTPRGRNHFKDFFDMAEKSDEWFAERLSVLDTNALAAEELDAARSEYHSIYGEDIGSAMFEQEYLVSFNAAILGAFYAREMVAVRNEGRIDSALEAIPDRPVHRAWDIGVRDDTTIWWFQMVGAQLFILDSYSASGVGVDHYAEIVEQRRSEHGWIDGKDYVPHDARVKEWGTGRTRVETMQGHGLNPHVVPQAGLLDGINAARRTIPRCVFHDRCEDGINALEQYRREWDDDKKAFRANPLHDWSSHYADAFRYLALAWQEEYKPPAPPKPKPVATDEKAFTFDGIRKARFGR